MCISRLGIFFYCEVGCIFHSLPDLLKVSLKKLGAYTFVCPTRRTIFFTSREPGSSIFRLFGNIIEIVGKSDGMDTDLGEPFCIVVGWGRKKDPDGIIKL